LIRKISGTLDKPLRELTQSERRAVLERFAPMLGISVRNERLMCLAEQELGDLTAKGLELLLIDQAHRDMQSQNQPIHQTGDYNPFAKHWEP
jgi:hypothetical protein